MFGRSHKNDVSPNRIDSLIGEGTEIVGNVQFKGGLRLEGRIQGNVSVGDEPGVLMVGPIGQIEGDIRVTHLIVDGTIRGSVYAEKGIELRPTARVLGNIHYGTLEMHAGAVFEGHMVSHQTPLLLASESPSTQTLDAPHDSSDSSTAQS